MWKTGNLTGWSLFTPKREFFQVSCLVASAVFLCLPAGAAELEIPRIETAPRLAALTGGTPPPGMTKVTGFIQTLPYDGEPATQDTEVFLAYDQLNIYAVFFAYDEPSLVRANLAQREDIDDDDFVAITLDPFGDQRRAYVFESNPLGVQRDQTFVEGQGFDETYDTVWTSEGALTDWGYIVIMALPFRSLRFPPDADAPWGLIVERIVPRDTEEFSSWPHISSSVDGRLNQAATMHGIRSVTPGRNLQFIPYMTLTTNRGIDERGVPRFVEEDLDPDAGLDIKKVWRDSIVADLTINPDFSQVESDQPQVTVNQRFEVFFPERRPFFLENADFFVTPVNLLFTRRIADPRAGARVTARRGRWSVGTLIADDELPGNLLPADDPNAGDTALFSAARVSRDIGEQSRIGALFVRREFAGDENSVGALDGRIKWNEQWVSSWQAASSSSTRPGSADVRAHSAYFSLNRSGRHFNYSGVFRDISEDFEADAGFVPRTGIRQMTHFASLFWWPQGRGNLVRWGPEFFLDTVWDRDGKRLDEAYEVSLEWEFPGQTGLEINVNRSRELLTAEDFPVLAADRNFDTDFINIEYGSARWKTLSIDGDTSIGKRINFSPLPGGEPAPVDWLGSALDVSYRPVPRLGIDATAFYNRFENDETGALVIEDLIGRARVNWQFSRELSLRTIVQYERTRSNPAETSISNRRNWNVDVLVTYRLNPWTAAYLGYNQNRQNVAIDATTGMPEIVRTDDLLKDSEQWILKVSYLVRR